MYEEVKKLSELSNLIAQKGYTQKQFAEEIGVTPGAIHLFVKGIKKPSVAVLEEMAKLLDVTPNDILGWNNK